MRIFFTHILPESLILKHGLSPAACNFSFNLMSGGGFDKVFSTLGTNVGGNIEHEAYVDPRFELVYIHSLRTKGRIGRLLANVFEQVLVFSKIPCRSNIWLYNISSLNVILYLLLRLFKYSVQINIIELDFTPPAKRLSIGTFMLLLLNKSHGIIRLSDSDLFTNKNSVCLAGVTPKEGCQAPLILEPKMEFLLSGVLQPNISSIPWILDAFGLVPECTLHITGKWDDMQLMDYYTNMYPNIIYHGVVSFKEYLNILHSITFQMSLRNPDWGDNSCNFPSKVIEALLHNRIVISTIHYKQIEGMRYFVTERSVDGFVSILRNLSTMQAAELITYANQGEETARRYSAEVWNRWMNKIEQVAKN